ncbi:MAG TPA: DHA2 family efflux MFS transporter permease subunit [Candidatus Binatia bacterium]|nr:DHA2 family efflux MFS transporter permease subunit [Candidatus Binatia bacterium]
MKDALSARQRWLALYLLCIGVLMIVLDTTVVTVALPTIRADLGFTETGLVWVLNAYMLTYGGLLLLGGRLGDLYGQRRLFLLGLCVFTAASLACGVATSQASLIAARAIQGVGGAVVTAVALALILHLFTDDAERAKAMGVYGFICAAGGSVGELLGGVLTSAFGWHSVFLLNLPIGIAVYVWCLRLLPADAPAAKRPRLDVAGALTVTLGLMLAVYAVVGGNAAGWRSAQTLGALGAAALLLVSFLAIEARVRDPLMPLRLFALRNVAIANAAGVLWAAGMFGWFVVSALYLQRVLGYDPMRVGLAFLPADAIMAAFSAGLSARMVQRYGIRGPAWLGLALASIGLALFARAPEQGTFLGDVLPGMALLGLGAGMAFNPILLAAMNDVRENEAGLASGVVNTSFMLGGALGLAALAALGDARTATLAGAGGTSAVAALNQGYHLAFAGGAAMTALAALLCGALMRPRTQAPAAFTPG